jgi:hypothetical protein
VGNVQRDGRDVVVQLLREAIGQAREAARSHVQADRKLWLQLLEGSFKLIYKEQLPSCPVPLPNKEAAN